MSESDTSFAATRGGGQADFRGRTLVVADDSALFRRFLTRAVSLLGCAAEPVEDRSALATLLERSVPDGVILDWNFDGEPSRDILADLSRRGVPVLVVTGDPEGLAGVEVPLLVKPVHLADLERRLTELWTHP